VWIRNGDRAHLLGLDWSGVRGLFPAGLEPDEVDALTACLERIEEGALAGDVERLEDIEREAEARAKLNGGAA
jgi:hypothetical protein